MLTAGSRPARAPRPARPPGARPAGGTAAQLRALVGVELRQQWRYRVVALVLLLATALTGLVLALPEPARPVVAAWLLMLDTAVLGTTLAGALLLLDRGNRVLAALFTSPAGPGWYLTARVAVLTGLVLLAAVPIALAGRLALPAALAGVGLTAVLTMLIAIAIAARCRSVIGFMTALPLGLLPLVLPVLLHGAGLGHPLLFAVPTTGAMALVQGGFPAAGWGLMAVGWLVLASVAAAVVGYRQLRRYQLAGPAPRSRARPERWAGVRPGRVGGRVGWATGPVRGFLRSDLANLARDRLLVLIATSPILLGLAIRFGYSPVRDWLASGPGFDLDPYRPLLLAAAVLLHLPVAFGMVGALLVLDDVDDRALWALRTSPLGLPRYLGYRTGLVTVAAVLGLVVAVPLSGLAGLADWRLWPVLLLAALLAPMTMLGTLAVARDKVSGVVMLKLLGLPLYAPLASWWLTGPAAAALAVLPPWWALQALWVSWPYAVAGLAVTGLVLGLLARLALRRLATTHTTP